MDRAILPVGIGEGILRSAGKTEIGSSGNLFPGDFTIDPVFVLLFLCVCLCFAMGIKNMIDGFKAYVPETFVLGYKKPSLKDAIIDTVKYDLLQHSRFKNCVDSPADEERVKGHMILFYGFIACAIVTSIVAVSHWGGKVVHILAPIGHTPMPLWHPVKILANVGAVLLLTGLTLLTRRRLNADSKKSRSNYYDWYLLGIDLALVVGQLGEHFVHFGLGFHWHGSDGNGLAEFNHLSLGHFGQLGVLLVNPGLGQGSGEGHRIGVKVFLGQVAQHFGNIGAAITLQIGHKRIHRKNLASFRHGVLL